MPTLSRKFATPVPAPSGATTKLHGPELVSAPASSPKGKRFYAPELDALRFGAFLMVFCRHITSQFAAIQQRLAGEAAQAAGATSAAIASVSTTTVVHGGRMGLIQGFTQSLDFGVCLFFFLSSFLITRLLLIERDRTGTVEIREFYIRRSLRIWPLYFAFIAVVVVLSHWLPILHVDQNRVFVCLFFVANWAAVLHGWAGMAIQPLWSISVEEQFYLVWPWLARGGRGAILKVSAGFTALSLCTLLYLGSRHGLQVTSTWPNTLVQMIFFAGGACTAVLSKPETRRLATWLRLVLIGSGLAAWTAASAGFHVVRTNSPGAASLVAGYLLVLLGTFLLFTGVAGWSATRIPAWLIHMGRISYGLYVFHVVCLLLAEQMLLPVLLHHLPSGTKSILIAVSIMAVAGLMLTVPCAMLSYRFLEQPFIRLKERFTVVSSRPIEAPLPSFSSWFRSSRLNKAHS